MINRLILVILVLSSLTACKMEAVYFDFGKIVEGHYQNDYFNFKINVPDGWSAQAAGESEWKVQQGYFNEDTNQVDPDVKADIRDVDDALLVVMLQNEVLPDLIPSSITIFAEGLYYNNKVKNGKDYLTYSTQEIVEMGNFTILTEDYQEMTIDGELFYMMDAELDVNGQKVYQSFISSTMKEFGLSAILTYSVDAQKLEMIEILKKMDFYGE